MRFKKTNSIFAQRFGCCGNFQGIIGAVLLGVLLFPGLLGAYDISFIKTNSERSEFVKAYKHYAAYRKNLSAKKYRGAVTSLQRLSKASPEMRTVAYDEMATLLVRYFDANQIVRIAAQERAEFKRILYSKYLRTFLGKLAAQKISKKTAGDFYSIFVFIGDPELKKVQLYFLNQKSQAHSDVLKAAWLDDTLPFTRSKKPIFYSSAALQKIRANASYADWVAYYTAKYRSKEFRYIIRTVKDVAKRFEQLNTYPHDLYYIYNKALYRRRAYSRFLQSLTQGNVGVMLAQHNDLMIYLLNAYLRLDKEEDAVNFIKRLEKTNVDAGYLARLKFQLGEHYFKNDSAKFNDIVSLFKEIDPDRLEEDERDDMNWYLLNIKVSKGNDSDARNWIIDQVNATKNLSYASGYCYWSQKILAGDRSPGDATPQNCVTDYTNYYYGIKTGELQQTSPLFETCSDAELAKISGKNDAVILEWENILTRDGLDHFRNRLLHAAQDSISLNVLNRIAHNLESRGEYHKVQSILSEFFPGWWNQRWPEPAASCGFFYRLAYPEAFKSTVLKFSNTYKTDPKLVLSIMREESHFNPGAVSSANAIGLMQLIPATARFVAAKTKTRYSRRKLKDPEYNIKFGQYYISNLLDRFSGNVAHSLAAYNGGPTNVKRWLKTNSGFDEDVFVELIPFRETRNYVKKVKRTYYLYNHLYP